MTLIYLLIIGNIFLSFILYFNIKKEQKRNRILNGFIVGIIRAVSDYKTIVDDESVPELNTKFPIPYKKLMEAVEYELVKDFENSPRRTGGVEDFIEWSKESEELFVSKKHGNTSFAQINYSLFDKIRNEVEKGTDAIV